MNKPLMLMITLIALIALCVPAVSADEVFSDWVKEGDSFEVSGKTYVAAAGESISDAIIMGPEGVFVIKEGECSNIGGLNFCMDNFKYTVGGNITVHGSDTQQFYVTVNQPGADLEIDRSIDEGSLMIGDVGEVTIDIINNGDVAAKAMVYEEQIPPEFEIVNNYNIEVYGNRLTWRGTLGAESSREMSYKIKARDRFNGQITANLTYNDKVITDKLGVRSSSFFNINFDADDIEMDMGDESRFYITLSNNREEESGFEIETTVPSNLEIQATQFNDTEGNVMTWDDKVDAGEEAKITTAIKAVSPGVATITATAWDTKDRAHPDTKTFNITVVAPELEVYFIHDDINAGEEGEFKLYLKNPSSNVEITDVKASVKSKFFEENGSMSRYNPKQYEKILSVKFTANDSFSVDAAVTFKVNGREMTVNRKGTVEVKKPVEENADDEGFVDVGNGVTVIGGEPVENNSREAGDNVTPDKLSQEKIGVIRYVDLLARLKDLIIPW